MSVTNVALKSNVFLALDDAKDWLKIKLDNTEHDNRIRRLLNMATDLCERYIGGPIKNQQFTEQRDGDSTNTIVPDHWPVRSVQEIKVDYNRQFGNETLIDASAYIIRGPQSFHSVGIQGSDVVIRDDNNIAIVGRIFMGSVVGSVRIKYTAGWGQDMTEIPYDLQQAVLLTLEYYYILRENRELNVKSKGNTGQSYSRDSGLPVEVEQLLDQYKDYSLGHNNMPQKNTVVI